MPSTATISRDEFVEATTDLWEIAPESATKVGHPAPFPVELPKRLIELYTYEGDVVLDPFMGSGSAALAAVRTGRHFIGFDTDKSYVAAARRRVTDEQARLSLTGSSSTSAFRVELPAVTARDSGNDAQAQAVRDGLQAKELAGIVLSSCGFTDIRADVKPRGLGIALTFVATDQTGGEWAFDVSGAFTTNRAGLRRADTLWKSLGKAAVLHESRAAMPLILLTTDAPARGTAGHKALDVMRGPGHPIVDVIELLSGDDQARLRDYAQHGPPSHPV